MDVQYTPNGPEGQCCVDCANFQVNAEDAGKGMCFGHEVDANGNCNFFKKKE
ncbi:MAG: hypothetical protein WC650_04145 [Candidatus Doudnabacteria bacterium]